MKLKLTDLDPHFLQCSSPGHYDESDKIAGAEGLQLRCPACHWAGQRTGNGSAHMLTLWRDPAHWHFVGRNYRDLSLMAGRVMVGLTAGGCHARFYVRGGKVDFF